jgi:O-antigen/teichoic acid export membrane protein
MQKKLFSNMALLLGINLLIKPIWILVIDVSVQNKVGYESYGEYISMFNLALILTMLLDFGINNYNSTSIAKDPQILGKQFSQLISLKILLSAIYILSTLALAKMYGFSSTALYMILLLSVNQVIAHFGTYIRSNFLGLQLFKTDAWLSAMDRAVMIILGVLMLAGYVFETKISHFILIQSIGYISVLLLSFRLVWPHIHTFSLSFDSRLLFDIFKKTYPYAILVFIMLLYSKWDVLFIKKMLSDGNLQNGIYARAGRILEAATLMIGSAATIMLPLFARMIGNKDDLTPIIKSLLTLVAFPVITFSIWASVNNRDVMGMLPVGENESVFSVFSILILVFIPQTFIYIFGALLTAGGYLRTLIIICSIGLLISLVANIWLIPYYGAIGAAIAALITQVTVGFGKVYWAIIKMKISYSLFDSISMFLYILMISLVAFWLNYIEINFVIAGVVLFVMYTVYALFLGPLKYSYIHGLIRTLLRPNKQ